MKTFYSERDYAFGKAIFTLRTKIGLTQEQLGNTPATRDPPAFDLGSEA